MVRRLPRRRRPRPHLRRHAAQGRPHQDDADRRPLPGRPHRHLPPRHAPRRRPRPRRDRLSHRLDQAGPRHPRRRHHHPRAQGRDRGAPRLQALDPGGLLRPLPRRRRRLRGPPRRHREAPAQRRLLHLRDGDLRRPRLRLPLRLPRPPPPRGDPRAPRARVRPRPHHHRALGDLPHPQDRRHAPRDAQPRRHARPGAHRPHRGAADQGDDPRPRRLPRRRPQALPGPPRRAARPHLRRRPRAWSSTTCRSPRWSSTSTTG